MIAIGCDHGGLELKNLLARRLREAGHPIRDCGVHTGDEVDYPHMAEAVCQLVAAGKCELAILICGTGIGMSMAANKLEGIRCALCADCFSARMAREHNNANALALGARTTGAELAWMMVETFLAAKFQGGKHASRVEQIMALERHTGQSRRGCA